MATAKSWFLDTTGQLRIWAHSSRDIMYQTYTRSMEAKPAWRGEGWVQSATSGWGVIDSCWERQSQRVVAVVVVVVLRFWLLWGQSCSRRWSHAQEYSGIINWTPSFQKKGGDHDIGGRVRGGSELQWDEDDQNRLCKILKELIEVLLK